MRTAAAALLGSLALAAGCATPQARRAYGPAELRDEVRRRAPAVEPGEIVVPYQVTGEQVALARAAVAGARSDAERAQLLSAALFAPRWFGLRYAWSVTADAQETITARQGNCLALASVFVGLARELGLDAYYMDASVLVQETRFGEDGIVVHAGHVTALVKDRVHELALDFAPQGTISTYRVLTDVEALAHHYNNRGYDLIERARDAGEPVDWAASAHQFWLAVQVAPGLAAAWNNLGIASVRLGRRDEAVAAYREAIAREPRLGAPRNNLALVLLAAGDVDGAVALLQEAARLEPRGPHIHFNLATARARRGERGGALEEVRRALALRHDYPEAEALLARLSGAAEPEDEAGP